MDRPEIGIDAWQKNVPSHIRGPAILGAIVVGAWALGLAIWASLAPLEGAVLASGSFVATGQNKQVQHLEGGIIRELLVQEGDVVEAGQTVVRVDDTQTRAKLRRLILRSYRLLAMQARLEAQIRSDDDFELPPDLAEHADDPDVARIVARQRLELEARRARQADEEKVLRREIAALGEAIGGYRSQADAVKHRMALFKEELADKQSLLDRQLARKTDVMALRRAEAGLAGDRGELMSRIADSKERIARAEQQIAKLRSSAIEDAVEELRKTEGELDDVHEQIGAARDVVQRSEVRAPARGIVVKQHYYTRGAVVAPGAVILELLPVNDALMIEGRIRPADISHVHKGQDALVRLTALNQRLTPVISGKVTYVSADAISGQPSAAMSDQDREGPQSFVVRIKLNEEDVRAKVRDFKPTPGMPADVYIATGERTFFEYMLRPLLDSFSRAFREA
jgi:membrane fusion protein, type I secretion system